MKVAICTPLHGQPTAEYTHSLFNLGIHTMRERASIELKRFCTGSANLAGLRNRLTERALEWGADWLLWIDGDMKFPPDTLLRLLAHDAPAVGCGYAQKQLPSFSTSPIPTTKAKADAKLVEPVDYVGCGVLLVRGSEVRALPHPRFAFVPMDNGIDMAPEDCHFCALLRKAGATILIDHALSWEVGHIGGFIYYNAHVERAMEREARASADPLS